MIEPEADHQVEVPPPIGGSWRNLYAGVLITLVLLIAAFYLFTRAFA